jgi:branched-chain amino acid transport system substrate-binding protein
VTGIIGGRTFAAGTDFVAAREDRRSRNSIPQPVARSFTINSGGRSIDKTVEAAKNGRRQLPPPADEAERGRRSMRFGAIAGTAMFGALLSAAVTSSATAQISDDKVKIGLLGDQSGMSADVAGKGAIVAARLAVQDFGGTVRGKPIEIVDADTFGKPDVASAIARRWFDVEQVDAVTDLPFTSVAMAVVEVAKAADRTAMVASAASSDLTGKACSPVSTHWADDTYALSVSTAKAIVGSGGDSWYFMTADYVFGHALERDATEAIKAAGGSVVGSVRHPLNTADFSSFLLQAQQSKAKIIGLASVGADTINAIKQASEFGIVAGGQRLAGLLVFISDIHSLGQPVAQGLVVSEGFYWDQNDKSRAWSKRFFDQFGKMPTKAQAATYTAIMQYLHAVDATGTDEAKAVNVQMKKMPVDFFGRRGSIRQDGRVLYDMTLYQVKPPAESRYAWDYYKEIGSIPKEQAFRPEKDGGCPLVQ